ncbi:HAD family hydrolase [Thalassotalea psychrophila]|uniref:HAD family hydrolase n=1 Tax=Thalassotalea psychrophila TaxID=3065647 RepID=A0ABY9TVT0_9GAMM|nr:HAD family hydrolase [Colwelliaceae bacterium SQ149]
MTLKIAMWSGPRNISTAMMRSWENRQDTQVVDEPFYAYYLAQTKVDHPMAKEVLASQSNSWQQVSEQLSQTNYQQSIFYQKHMTHHMLDDIDLTWTKKLSHCFLIRDPMCVINSYVKKMPSVNSDDIGIKRQLQLYQQITDITGQDIPIIDSKDVLINPKGILSKLCETLGIDFDENMLNWPKGTRVSDGVWAEHWYENVEASNSFAPYKKPLIKLSEQQRQLAQENDYYYQQLYQKRIISS